MVRRRDAVAINWEIVEETFSGEFSAGVRSSLPLDLFLEAAGRLLAESHHDSENWKSPLWDFTRAAKGHPELVEMSSREALRSIERWIRSNGQSWTALFDVYSEEDARVEFMHIWDVIRFAPGSTPLESALQKARQTPLSVSDVKGGEKLDRRGGVKIDHGWMM